MGDRHEKDRSGRKGVADQREREIPARQFLGHYP
jgi:hypothetical protein